MTELHEQSARLALKTLRARSFRAGYGNGLWSSWLELPGGRPGPTVVLVHGFSASGPSQYVPMVYHLLPRVGRIILPDLAGHGRSTVPHGGIDEEHLAASLAVVMDRALDQPAVFFATSMGGGVALRHALRFPDQVARLMLCSPLGAPISAAQAKAMKDIFAITSYRDALRFVDRLFPDGNSLRKLYALGVLDSFSRPRFRHLIQRIDSFEGVQPAQLRQLAPPTCLLWGQLDTLLPQAHLDYFRAHLPPATEFQTPVGYGHAPFLRKPRSVVGRLLCFMDGDAHTKPADPMPRMAV